MQLAALWVKKPRGGKFQFFDKQLQISDRDMGAQNFNFAPKFPPKWSFLAPNFYFLEENFRTKMSQQAKILRGGGQFCPL